MTAHDDAPRGRLAKWEAISATGATEIEALERLAELLREWAGDEPQVSHAR